MEVVELYFVSTRIQLAKISSLNLRVQEKLDFLIKRLEMQSMSPETMKKLFGTQLKSMVVSLHVSLRGNCEASKDEFKLLDQNSNESYPRVQNEVSGTTQRFPMTKGHSGSVVEPLTILNPIKKFMSLQ
ncbi:hypothetical protein Tco_0658071 [Tanacetum coccineum]